MKKDTKILAIESSCDETAAAVIGVENGFPVILSNIISSQADLHDKTGGVVPEIASRAHMEAMTPVVEEALKTAHIGIDDISHIAVTNGPGLIGSLLVGFNAAKTIAFARDLPFLPINHIKGHIYSALSEEKDINFPILALTVSGGHTSLTLMKGHGLYETIGETIDDAAGEAFDKVAKLLGLGYPGGPAVSQFALEFRKNAGGSEIKFPRPLMDKPNFDFSFSGLKTAVLTEVIKNGAESKERREELCFAFEEAAVDVLCSKAIKAARKYRPHGLLLAGGVAANSRLREELKIRIKKYNDEVEEKNRMNFYLPDKRMAGDNAAMIGLAAYYHIGKDDIPELFSTTVDSNSAI